MYVYMCILPSKKNSPSMKSIRRRRYTTTCRNHIVDKSLVVSNLLQLLPLGYRELLYCPLQLMREEPGATSSKGYCIHKKKPKTQKNTQTKQELSCLNEVQAALASTAVLSCMKLQRAWVLTSSAPSSLAAWYTVPFSLVLSQNTQILLKQELPTLVVVVLAAAAAQPCNSFMSKCAAAASVTSNSI